MMCTFFGVSRSGYYDYVERLQQPEKDASLAGLLRKQQEHCFHTYGYRRMHMWLEKQGIHRNPKTILRIMKKYGLLSEIRRYRKWRQLRKRRSPQSCSSTATKDFSTPRKHTST